MSDLVAYGDYPVLYVGDVHATPEELDDCWNLINFVVDLAEKHQAHIFLLGDQYNTHNVLRLEVVGFWQDVFELFENRKLKTPYALVGNHDYGGEGAMLHAMRIHRQQYIYLIDQPAQLPWSGLALPYMSNPDDFINVCNKNERFDLLVCHQTFNGSVGDNDFALPGGVNPNLLPQKQVISGHIHTQQSFGKVWYPGAPRWRTLSDANKDRAVWLVVHDHKGNIKSKQAFDTGQACRKIHHLIDTPENQVPAELEPRHDYRIDIKGPQDFVTRRKAELSRPGVRIRSFPTRSYTPKVRESEGIATSFKKYMLNFTPKHGTDYSTLEQMAKERLGV